MASVQSQVRSLLKPLLFKFLGPQGYSWFQYYGKVKDIEQRLVEEPEMVLLPHLLGDSSVAIDVGANYAYYTVRMAQLSTQGKVFAFEPIPFTHQVCKKIIEKFRLNNVALFQLGVGESEQTLTFEVPIQKAGSISAGQAHMGGRNNKRAGKEKYHPFDKVQTFECKVISIDKFLPDLKRVDFIKIDIEGAELFALKGMKGILSKFKPALLIECCPFMFEGFGIKEIDLKNFIEEAGYETFALEPSSKRLVPHLTTLVDGNYILLHRERLKDYKEILHHDS